MTQFLQSRGKVFSGAPGRTPHLGAPLPQSLLVLCQLDRTEVAPGRERKADGIGGTEGKQEMFLVGERLSDLMVGGGGQGGGGGGGGVLKNARPIMSREAE